MSRAAGQFWNDFVQIFIERFLIVVCATAFYGVVITNTMQIDLHYRIGTGIILVGIAYILGHAVHKANTKLASSTVASPQTTFVPTVASPVTSSGKVTVEKPGKTPKNSLEPGPATGSGTPPPSRPPPPPIEHLRFTSRSLPSSPYEDAPYGVEIVVQTDIPIQPAQIHVECDSAIIHAQATIPGTNLIQMETFRQWPDRPNIYEYSFEQPAFAPIRPVSITIWGKEELHITTVKSVPYTGFMR